LCSLRSGIGPLKRKFGQRYVRGTCAHDSPHDEGDDTRCRCHLAAAETPIDEVLKNERGVRRLTMVKMGRHIFSTSPIHMYRCMCACVCMYAREFARLVKARSMGSIRALMHSKAGRAPLRVRWTEFRQIRQIRQTIQKSQRKHGKTDKRVADSLGVST
jgi:hypothetical protein